MVETKIAAAFTYLLISAARPAHSATRDLPSRPLPPLSFPSSSASRSRLNQEGDRKGSSRFLIFFFHNHCFKERAPFTHRQTDRQHSNMHTCAPLQTLPRYLDVYTGRGQPHLARLGPGSIAAAPSPPRLMSLRRMSLRSAVACAFK